MKVICINDNWTLTGIGPKVGDVLEPAWVEMSEGDSYLIFTEYLDVPRPTGYRAKHFRPFYGHLHQEEIYEKEGTILAQRSRDGQKVW